MSDLSIAVVVLSIAVNAAAQPSTKVSPSDGAPRHATVAPDGDVGALTLIRSTAGRAVVRCGTGALLLVSVGDRVGRQRAEVTAIDAGRIVLTERSSGRRGESAQIIIKVGETGGIRISPDTAESRPQSVRPLIVTPPAGSKKPPATGKPKEKQPGR